MQLRRNKMSEPRSYEKFDLKENPFKTHHGFSGQNFWAGDGEIRWKIKQLVNDVIDDKMQQYAIICGEYGTGKSYTLLYFTHQLSQNQFCPMAITLYIENPGNSLQQFYRSVIQCVDSRNLTSLAKKLVGTVSIEATESLLQSLNENVTDTSVFWEVLHERLSFDSLWPRVAEKGNILNDDLAKAITWLGIGEGEKRQYAWKWLTASPLTAMEMRKAKLSKTLEGPAIVEVLNQILHLIHFHLGKAIMMMIDEFEDILAIKEESQRISFLRALRRIIDGSPQAFGLIIACTAEGWRDGLLAYHPLASRLVKENFITLPELDKKMTLQFIIDYLTPYRTSSNPRQLFPFTGQAAEEIFRRTHGNQREIVKACRTCLKMKLEEEDTEITAEDVKRYFGEREHELL